MHFEDLWEICEAFHQKSEGFADSINIKELIMKLGVYESVSKSSLSQLEKQKAKSQIIGEILLFLTLVSVKDNINVYAALLDALNSKTS